MDVKIKLENTVLQPGDLVNGKAVLKVHALKCRLRSVRIFLMGKACTSWSVTRGNRTLTHEDQLLSKRSDNVQHSGTVIYIRHVIFPCEDMLKSGVLTCGTYEFPFQFQLPLNCAPSFEGKFGRIWYHIRAEFDRPMMEDYVVEQPFTVINRFDLNIVSCLADPYESIVCENTGMILFRRGNIQLKVSLPKLGFSVGELVTFRLSVHNMSTRDVVAADIGLYQITVNYACPIDKVWSPNDKFPSKNAANNVRRQKRNVWEFTQEMTVGPNASLFEIIQKKIPHTVIPAFQCPIIKVEYQLEVEVFSNARFFNSIKAQVPLLIGTVPIPSTSKEQEFTEDAAYQRHRPQTTIQRPRTRKTAEEITRGSCCTIL